MRPGLPDPLIDLLGGRWAMGAPVAGIAWFGGVQVAGFALADGTMAIARAGWDGAAELRPREGGGVELVPASEPAPPVMRAGVHEGACLAVAADGSGGLLTGGADGRLALVAPDGLVETLAQFSGTPVEQVASGSGVRACAASGAVHRLGQDAGVLELPGTVTGLAFDPPGRTLAIAHAKGVTLWSGGEARLLAGPGAPGAISWSPDGAHVVATAPDGLTAWRVRDGAALPMPAQAAPRSLAFSAPGGFLATSGGQRVICWRLEGAAEPVRTDCGVRSVAVVTHVACHPRRPLIAVGYQNGVALLCQPDSLDILFVREAGDAAITALAWSADGAWLALAAGGDIGVVAFPERLFRAGPIA